MDSLDNFERHLIQSEVRAADGDIADRLEARAKVHRMICDERIGADDVALAARAAAGACFGVTVVGGGIDAIRTVRRAYNVTFPSCEPVDTAALIAQALLHIRGSMRIEGNPAIVFGTDCAYRPHGSIGPLDDGTFCIVMSRYLLCDMAMVCRAVAETALAAAPEGAGDGRFLAGLGSDQFIAAFKSGEWHAQSPYILTALAACEKYRYGLLAPADADPEEQRLFHMLCVVFFIAHELAHIAHGDFSDDDRALVPAPHLRRIIRMHSDPALAAAFGTAEIERFWTHCGPGYLREFSADLRATLVTAGAANPIFGNAEAGFAAAAAALSALAWGDRAEFFSQTGHDPLKAVGREIYNSVPMGIDIALFRMLADWETRGHPWGKTRFTTLGVYLAVLLHLEFVSVRNDVVRTMIANVGGLFSWSMPEAMAVLKWIRRKKGEWVAASVDARELLTTYAETIEGERRFFYYRTPLEDLYGQRNAIQLD